VVDLHSDVSASHPHLAYMLLLSLFVVLLLLQHQYIVLSCAVSSIYFSFSLAGSIPALQMVVTFPASFIKLWLFRQWLTKHLRFKNMENSVLKMDDCLKK